LKSIKQGIKRPQILCCFTKSGEKVPTQFCPVCPHATINTSVKLENPQSFEKMENADPGNGCQFKPQTSVQKAIFIF
jgi:hypothetical protein